MTMPNQSEGQEARFQLLASEIELLRLQARHLEFSLQRIQATASLEASRLTEELRAELRGQSASPGAGSDLVAAREELQTAQRSLQRLQEETRQQEMKHRQELEALHRDRQSACQQLEQLRDEFARRSNELDAANTARRDFEAQVRSLEERMDEATAAQRSQQEAQAAQRAHWEGSLRELEKLTHERKSQADALESELRDLRAQEAALSDQNRRLEADRQAGSLLLEESTARCSLLQSEVARLIGEAEQMQTHLKECEAGAEELLRSMQRELVDAQTLSGSLQARVKALEEELGRLQPELSQAHQHAQESAAALQREKDRAAGAEATARQQRENYLAQQKGAERQLDEQHQMARVREQELEKALAIIRELKAELGRGGSTQVPVWVAGQHMVPAKNILDAESTQPVSEPTPAETAGTTTLRIPLRISNT